MTAIASFLRKTPVTRLHDYFTGSATYTLRTLSTKLTLPALRLSV